jgi:hypothetical protein
MERLRIWTEGGRDAAAAWTGSIDLARAGLVVGTVVLAIGAFGALSLWQVAPSPSAGEGEEIEAARAASPAPSRLPRARPSEPATTGSIRPSSEAAGSQTTVSPQAIARNRRLDELQTRAIMIASSWSECDQVEDLELFELQGGAPDQVLISIHCANGTRFVLGEADIAANRISALDIAANRVSAAERPSIAPASDLEVVRACEDKVRQGLPFPGSLNRVSSSTGVIRASDDAIVTFDFGALNGFGFPLFFQVQCVFENREIARLELNPR